jgi:hypothetical protein
MSTRTLSVCSRPRTDVRSCIQCQINYNLILDNALSNILFFNLFQPFQGNPQGSFSTEWPPDGLPNIQPNKRV